MWTSLALALGLGIAAGALAERLQLCTMGAVADVVVFGSWRRARIWAAIAGAAALSFALAGLVGALQPVGSLAWRGDALAAALGGILFGVGMVHAGGCLSRAILRAAAGSAQAIGLVLVAVAAAIIVLALWPVPAALPSWSPHPILAAVTAGAVAAPALIWSLRDERLRTTAILGPVLGLGVLLALATIADPATAAGLRFVPVGEPTAPALALALGYGGGALLSAFAHDRFRPTLEPWSMDTTRAVAGAAAMGAGGALAGGCTIAAGTTGVALLAPAALAALAGMILGSVVALKLMLAGGPGGLMRRLRQPRAAR